MMTIRIRSRVNGVSDTAWDFSLKLLVIVELIVSVTGHLPVILYCCLDKRVLFTISLLIAGELSWVLPNKGTLTCVPG